jgi:holin-like protein
MLFVPAGVGVVAYSEVLHAEFVPVVAAVIGGTLVTILTTAVAAEFFRVRVEKRRERAELEQERPEAADVIA